MENLCTLSTAEVIPILGKRMIRNEPGLVEFAGLILRDSKVNAKLSLFHVMEFSKKHANAAIASGNAFTLLNAARESFSTKNLANMRLCNADMRAAMLHRTNLAGCDLRNALLAESVVAGASLDDCIMNGVDFGQNPDIEGNTDTVTTLHVLDTASAALKIMAVSPHNNIKYWMANSNKSSRANDLKLSCIESIPLPQGVNHGENRTLPLCLSTCKSVIGTMTSDKHIDIKALSSSHASSTCPNWSIDTAAPIIVNTTWPFRNSVRISSEGKYVACLLRNHLLQVFVRPDGGKSTSPECIIEDDVITGNLKDLKVSLHHKG